MATYDLTSQSPTKFKKGDIINCPYSGAVQAITLPKGTYKLECWGAQGGSYSTTYHGGYGGYSVGTLALTKSASLYLYAGGAGSKITTTATQLGGGFNGGGSATTTSTGYLTAGGGGGSDIRIGTNSLYSRVIVAGGGGGYGNNQGQYVNGGAGGGTSGIAGGSASTSYLSGKGGSATAVGTSYYSTTAQASGSSYSDLGGFGKGASALTNASYSSGGGGGWYGGGSARRAGGGGGSGYVYTSSTASNYPAGCLLDSAYYLTDVSTIDGTTSFINYDGTTVTGHSGDGYIRITVIESTTVPLRIKVSDTEWKIAKGVWLKTSDEQWTKYEG